MLLHKRRVLANQIGVGDNVAIRISIPGALRKTHVRTRKAPQTVANIETESNGDVRFNYKDGTRSRWFGPQTRVEKYVRLPRRYRNGIYASDVEELMTWFA